MKQLLEDYGRMKNQVDEIVLDGGQTRIPKVQQLLKDPVNGKEPNRDTNPEETVPAVPQYGPASRDGTPPTLGIGTAGGETTKRINQSAIFSTCRDKQPVGHSGLRGRAAHDAVEEDHYRAPFSPPTGETSRLRTSGDCQRRTCCWH